MAITKKTKDNKCQQGCVVHSKWKYKSVLPLQKTT